MEFGKPAAEYDIPEGYDPREENPGGINKITAAGGWQNTVFHLVAFTH